MPTYDWRCKECNHTFETFQFISEPDPKCPKCGSEVKKRLTGSHKICINEPHRMAKDRMN